MATIGIMDSGVGGLSVFREIRRLLPSEHYVYYSDSANCPYGEKDPEFIRNRCREIARLMVSRGADAMVIACNTATAAAISMLRNEFSMPFIGMEPAVKPAALGTRTGVIGVLATAGTLKGSNSPPAPRRRSGCHSARLHALPFPAARAGEGRRPWRQVHRSRPGRRQAPAGHPRAEGNRHGRRPARCGAPELGRPGTPQEKFRQPSRRNMNETPPSLNGRRRSA